MAKEESDAKNVRKKRSDMKCELAGTDGGLRLLKENVSDLKGRLADGQTKKNSFITMWSDRIRRKDSSKSVTKRLTRQKCGMPSGAQIDKSPMMPMAEREVSNPPHCLDIHDRELGKRRLSRCVNTTDHSPPEILEIEPTLAIETIEKRDAWIALSRKINHRQRGAVKGFEHTSIDRGQLSSI